MAHLGETSYVKRASCGTTSHQWCHRAMRTCECVWNCVSFMGKWWYTLRNHQIGGRPFSDKLISTPKRWWCIKIYTTEFYPHEKNHLESLVVYLHVSPLSSVPTIKPLKISMKFVKLAFDEFWPACRLPFRYLFLLVKHRQFAALPHLHVSTAGKLVIPTRANDETSTTPIRHAFHGCW